MEDAVDKELDGQAEEILDEVRHLADRLDGEYAHERYEALKDRLDSIEGKVDQMTVLLHSLKEAIGVSANQ